MFEKSKKIELLAPAKDFACAKAAVISGADAVYIGADSFGARKNASNNTEDIEKLVLFAHKFNVKIYVTVNTILNDDELQRAQKLIYKLCEIGVDAIIVQDMGLFELELPDIEIHASTQCDIRTLEKVKFFENLGVKRVILSRELSVDEISKISENSKIELECFIHGALCVSYSGQCYMSLYNGGRSANKGVCAQACREKYSLVRKNGAYIQKDKYLLSLKDFCAADYIEKLVFAGVKSFKIEGRLKDENYVKNVVLYYRKLLDKIPNVQKSSDGVILPDFEPDINKTFIWGCTSYFLSGKDDNIFNFQTPKSTGEFLGCVKNAGKNYFEIDFCKKDIKINPQDGLCFFFEGNLRGCLVNKIENNRIFPNKPLIGLKKGDKIFRNNDSYFEKKLLNSKIKRLIEVEVTVDEKKITVTDGVNSVYAEYSGDLAHDFEKMKNNFIAAFNKSGESLFKTAKIEFLTDKVPFFPISKLNSIRRELFSELENLRVKNYKRNTGSKIKPAPYPPLNCDYRLNIFNNCAANFYKKCEVKKIEFSLESTKNFKEKELMRTKHCLRCAFGICLKKGGKSEKLFLENNSGKKFPLEFDCKNCEMIVKAPDTK